MSPAKVLLTKEQVKAIRRIRSEGAKLEAVAIEFGISVSWVSRICSGPSWRGVR